MYVLGSSTGIILFSCLSLIVHTHVHAQDPFDPETVRDPELQRCVSNSETYASNSQFETNLNLVLRSLVSNGTQDGFWNTTIGDSPDTVYGLVQCRGDVSMDLCGRCLTTSSVEIVGRCPNLKVAALRYEHCLLHYSNRLFFSQPDNNPVAAQSSLHVSDAVGPRFDEQLRSLLNNLSNTAASRPTRYNSGSANYTSGDNIYAQTQCTRDLSTSDCFSCLQNMTRYIPSCCNRSIGARIYTTTCKIRYEITPFVRPPSQARPPPPPLPPSNTVEGPGKGNSTNIVAIIVPIVGSLLFLAICAFFIATRIRRNRRKTKPELVYDQDTVISEKSLQFDLNMIRTATNDFSDANKLGQGGFGAVYKGELLDGQEIAVKRLSLYSQQGSQEFKNEVVLMHKLQHRNLVRLLGFCWSGEEKLLIYEYVANKSLDKYIFDPTKKESLDWERRYKIIGGIARGLLYLHEDSRLRIIHRDLKAGNILLDEEMNAKIADFGMAKLFDIDQTQGNTSRIAGTYGYMAPEYALHGLFSVKSDVYSFGVLVLEIISGYKANNFHHSGLSTDLLSYVWKLWREGNALQLLDETLMESYSADEAMRCIHIGMLCVQENLEDRPTMSSVVLMLNSYSLTLQTPSAPAFAFTTGANYPSIDLKSNQSSNSSLQHSIDGVSSLMNNPR